ncbi:unnamed protein product, partial [Rotaria sp. Silwood1]
MIEKCSAISSPLQPFTTYRHSTELQANVADLWWTVDVVEREVMFELHIKTTGWIALGISPAGGMKGADIGVGWVDNMGKVHFQDRYAFDYVKPIIDNTTTDWYALQGREQNGWTAIQFKRLIDTCDSMDVPIKIVEFPSVAGYPVGGDFPIQYYLIQMHYDNPKLVSHRHDSSGIRFYIGKELRQYDLGYLTFGIDSGPLALAIPPGVDRFVVDSYCPANASRI